jgi:PAS domain S-box-containing protein
MDPLHGDPDRHGGAAHAPLPPSLLGLAFEAAPNGLLVVDGQARIVAGNTALLRMFDYEAAELIGQPLELLVPQRQRETHQALRIAYLAAPERRAMGSGRELHARDAHGREFPVEIGLNPMRTPQGTMVLASVVDTSQRRDLESALARIFESATQGMVLVDVQGRMALLNERLARMLGRERAALLGRPLEILLPERFRAHHAGLMRSYHAAPSTRGMGVGRDLAALHADGAELPVEIGLSEVHWHGEPMTLATVIDISVRRRMELDLKRANENLREFAHVASHDLKSPLRGIADLVSWVREDLGAGAPATVQHNLERIADRVTRMERLISDLLRYARSEQAEADLDLIDFQELVTDILRVDPLPPGLVVEVRIAAPPLLAPRTPVETVLRNLIGNAAKHHDRASGRIGIEVSNDRGYCRISVADDGPGIPAAAQERVFRIFQTASHAPNPGSGLGLALTKRLVEVHGGRIELHSPRSDQRGSDFRIWWPRQPGSPTHERSIAVDPAGRG